MEEFTKELIKARKQQGLSIYKWCLCCGLSWGSYLRIEEGNGMTLKTLLKLSKGVDLEFGIKNGKVTILN